jgi:hypothetical protein
MTRLRGGLNCVLEPLYHCAFNLHQLDMCQVVAPQKAMKDFFEANKKSIRGPFSGVPAGPVLETGPTQGFLCLGLSAPLAIFKRSTTLPRGTSYTISCHACILRPSQAVTGCVLPLQSTVQYPCPIINVFPFLYLKITIHNK